MARKTRTHVNGAERPLTPKHLTKQEFARRLYRLMISKGWHQLEFARQAGLPRDSVSVYMRGKSLPGPKVVAKLADALGVTPLDLLPNHVESAIEDDIPALDIKVSANAPGQAWLRVNQLVTTATAVKIADLLEHDEAAQRK